MMLNIQEYRSLIIEVIYYKDFLTADRGRLMHFLDFFGISHDMIDRY